MAEADDRRGAVASIVDKLLRALPPAYIALLIINGAFLWFESHGQAQRVALMDRVIESCMKQVEAR